MFYNALSHFVLLCFFLFLNWKYRVKLYTHHLQNLLLSYLNQRKNIKKYKNKIITNNNIE